VQNLRGGDDPEEPSSIDCSRLHDDPFSRPCFPVRVVLGARYFIFSHRYFLIVMGNAWTWVLVSELQEVQLVLICEAEVVS
jgi:hypothetical protein